MRAPDFISKNKISQSQNYNGFVKDYITLISKYYVIFLVENLDLKQSPNEALMQRLIYHIYWFKCLNKQPITTK